MKTKSRWAVASKLAKCRKPNAKCLKKEIQRSKEIQAVGFWTVPEGEAPDVQKDGSDDWDSKVGWSSEQWVVKFTSPPVTFWWLL